MIKVIVVMLALLTALSSSAQQKEQRVALVIGNSTYDQLGTLPNPKNDASEFARELAALGFSTKLLLNQNEQALRREIRAFSARTENAAVALVFYAGHGAQISGENYLLPVDLDPPSREADIQFSAIKVDDILVSMKSPVKIFFLDACRDNPVLFKTLSKGRGSSFARGLAPTKESPTSSETSSGGIFIGYATDSGNIAADGDKKNSPFTEALLRHVRKPVSIDDMFSMVTRDVRQATANKQRPYKYASMERVVCLSGTCGQDGGNREEGIISVGKSDGKNAGQEIQIALLANDKNKLHEIAKNYDDPKTTELVRNAEEQLGKMLTDEWVAVDATIDNKHFYYYQPSSVGYRSTRTWVDLKEAQIGPVESTDRSLPSSGSIGPAIVLNSLATAVFDCKARKVGGARYKNFDTDGNLLINVFFGDPRIIDLKNEVSTGSVNETIMGLVCPPKNAGRIVSAELLSSAAQWQPIATMADGGQVQLLKGSLEISGSSVTAITKYSYLKPLVTLMYTQSTSVEKHQMNCDRNEVIRIDADFLAEKGELVGKLFASNTLKTEPVRPDSVLSTIFKTVCLDLVKQ